MGWIKYFFGWTWRPRIPHHLVHPFDRTAASEDELLVMMAGRARDRTYIERLMRRHKASNAAELLARLPKRSGRPSVRERLDTLIMRLEGSQPYDPIRADLRQIRAEAAPPDGGIRRARLKRGNPRW